jgi:hypothetical protein
MENKSNLIYTYMDIAFFNLNDSQWKVSHSTITNSKTKVINT